MHLRSKQTRYAIKNNIWNKRTNPENFNQMNKHPIEAKE